MRDMISVASGFQYSVNIEYDIGNTNKLKNFIPTKSALSILEDILLSTEPKSSDRARVLIGAYGKGKSHIVLMILSILMRRDLKLFEKLLPKINENPKLFQLVKNYYESGNKILPVIITGSNTSLTQAFLLSLQRTLSEYDLLSAMPETNYKAADSTIRRWKKEFPETYKKFKDAIAEPVSVFLSRLNSFDVIAYESFEKIYPRLTAGSNFNPFLGFDVVELYESVAKSLKAKGYSGIYVVYDEFSKFLEANITNASLSDTKMLQDFAEKCARSGKMQLHLMLISHKEISNYIDKLPKEKVDGWRGVSERFRHIHMNNNFTQTYEIISSVIQHNEPLWGRFCAQHTRDFDSLYKGYRKHRMFLDGQEEIDTAIKGCYPLHPVSTFILPRLSERVAQNERTLFTFLSAEGTATLPSFLDKYDNSFCLITPDIIYDYFEPLFKKEIYSGEAHKVFVLASSIINQLEENSLPEKIVKTISLIYILEQFERLSPTKEQIVGIYSKSYSVDEINDAITCLIEKELVVYLKRSNDYLRLKQTSGIDIRQKIANQIEKQLGKISVKDILNNSNFDNYMYPSRYNDAHEMIRYFAFRFITGAEVNKDINWEIKSEGISADGIIYGILPESEEDLKWLECILKLTSMDYPRFIFVLPKYYREIERVVQEYAAVAYLRENSTNDPVLFDEYEVVFEDLQEIIREIVDSYTHPEYYRSHYICEGELLEIYRKSALTEQMSKICDKIYSFTPAINNESVNRDEITSVALTSRNKIISALLRSDLEINLGFSGTGQEVSIMRSTLFRTGVLEDRNGVLEINLRPQNEQMQYMLGVIERFILDARGNGPVSFQILYDQLVSPRYHIGMRYGLIPIYLAAVIHNYRQQIVLNNRAGQVQTTVDILVQINAEPSNFTLEYLEWNPEKEAYIIRLADIFNEYVVEAEKTGNTYDYVSSAMFRWFMALPKYSKECDLHPDGSKIMKRHLEMMKLLRKNISGSDLLFKKLPEVFGYQGDNFVDVAEEVANAKKVFDGLLDELKRFLIRKTQEIFIPKNEGLVNKNISLISTIIEWRESLDPKSFEQLFPDGTDRFLQHIQNTTNDENLFITRLVKLATGLRLEDWSKKTIEAYFESIEKYKKTAKDFHSSVQAETINETSSYQVVFLDDEGVNTTRRFDKIDVSARGKLLFNQIMASLDAMGHSISEQEKRQVLMEVLKKIC